MNTILADIYKQRIKDLPFVDQTRLAGLVRRYVKVDTDGAGKKIENYYPIGCTLTAEDCRDVSKYTYLVPDIKKKSIFFFEDRGVTFIERKRESSHWKSVLALVAWVNTKYFDMPGCFVSGAMVMHTVDALLIDRNFNSQEVTGIAASFQSVRPKIRQQMPKDQNIFSRYTIKEQISQYLLHPYDYFCLIIETEFETHPNCFPEIIVKDPPPVC